jgi:hypothetical protein
MNPAAPFTANTVQQQGNNKGHRWQKGQSGNPKGRPEKGCSITELVKEMLANDPKTKRRLVKMLLGKAMAGDLHAMKLVMQYVDGMPVQQQVVDANIHSKVGYLTRLHERAKQRDEEERKAREAEKKAIESNTSPNPSTC